MKCYPFSGCSVRISSHHQIRFIFLPIVQEKTTKKSQIYSSFVLASLSLCNFRFIAFIIELSVTSSCRVAGLSVQFLQSFEFCSHQSRRRCIVIPSAVHHTIHQIPPCATHSSLSQSQLKSFTSSLDPICILSSLSWKEGEKKKIEKKKREKKRKRRQKKRERKKV